MKLLNIQNNKNELKNEKLNINKKRENNMDEYIEKLNLKCETKVIKNTSELFSLYKSNPEKQFIFSLLSELNVMEDLFISNFIKEMKGKTENEIREFFPQKRKEYEDRIQLILEKVKQKLINNREIVNNLKQKNLDLKNKIIMIKNKNDSFKEEIKEVEISKKKLKAKQELFLKMKEIYDHYTSRFNNQEKNELEKSKNDLKNEFKLKKDLLKEVVDELNERKLQISQLKQIMVDEEIINRNNNYKLYNEFFDLGSNHKIIENKNKNKLLNIKEDINSNNLFMEENEKIHKSFISIFNLFYKELNLERNLIKNPKNINILKSDYTPKIFLNEELVNYIYLMLQNSNDESSFELLKDLITYIYMILRDTGIGFNKIKYDPVLAVNEIEKYFNITLDENEDLTKNIKIIKNKIIQENEIINQLNNQIQNIKNIEEDIKNSRNFNYHNQNIRKSLSAHNFKTSENMKTIKKFKTRNKFNKIKKKFETNLEEEKVPFFKDNLEALINRINKSYFSKLKGKTHIEKSIDRFTNAKKRIERKLNKIKKLQKDKQKFFTIENNLSSNINRHIDNLIFKIEKNYKID